MGKLVLILLAAGSVNDSARSGAGEVIEQATVGLMFGVLTGFVAGEVGWIAAPEFPDEEDPYRVSLPVALTSAYVAGLPFGSALGVHLAGKVTGNESAFWPKWIGAEAGALIGGGVTYLILNNTDDTLSSVVAYSLPLVTSLGGCFAGSWAAQRLGWADNGTDPPFEVGLISNQDHLGIRVGLNIRF